MEFKKISLSKCFLLVYGNTIDFLCINFAKSIY